MFITQQASEASDFRGVWQSGSAPGHGANGAYVNNVSVTNTRDDLYDAVAIGSPVVVSIHSTSTTWTGPNQMLLFGYGGAFALDGTVIDAVFYDASAVTDRADISTALEAAL